MEITVMRNLKLKTYQSTFSLLTAHMIKPKYKEHAINLSHDVFAAVSTPLIVLPPNPL